MYFEERKKEIRFVCVVLNQYWGIVTILLEQIGLPAKLLDYFSWSNKSNINQWGFLTRWQCFTVRPERTILTYHQTLCWGRIIWPCPFESCRA